MAYYDNCKLHHKCATNFLLLVAKSSRLGPAVKNMKVQYIVIINATVTLPLYKFHRNVVVNTLIKQLYSR